MVLLFTVPLETRGTAHPAGPCGEALGLLSRQEQGEAEAQNPVGAAHGEGRQGRGNGSGLDRWSSVGGLPTLGQYPALGGLGWGKYWLVMLK